MGAGLKCGLDAAIKAIEALLGNNPNWVVAALDASNAYGTVLRRVVLRALESLAPSLVPYVHSCLEHAVHGVVSGSDGLEFVQNLEGVLQGSPLSPALFCAAIANALRVTKSEHEGVYLISYLDDVFLLGELDDVRAAIVTMEGEFGRVGLALNKEKTSFFSPSQATYERLVQLKESDQEDRLEGKVHEEGLRVLGVPIATSIGVAEEVLNGRLEETIC